MIEIYNSVKTVQPHFRGEDATLLKFDHIPTITNLDMDNGYISRYFAQYTNRTTGEIIEINSQKFSTLEHISLYQTVEILWKIKGSLTDSSVMLGVLSANKKSVEIGNESLIGLNKKLTNYKEFYIGL